MWPNKKLANTYIKVADLEIQFKWPTAKVSLVANCSNSSTKTFIRTWSLMHKSSYLISYLSMMGGRHATCAYWVEYTQAHVVQWWPCVINDRVRPHAAVVIAYLHIGLNTYLKAPRRRTQRHSQIAVMSGQLTCYHHIYTLCTDLTVGLTEVIRK